MNRELENIKVRIGKHYQYICDHDTFVTAKKVYDRYTGLGEEIHSLVELNRYIDALRVKFYQIYQDLELEGKIISARAIVNRYQEKDETFKTLYNVFKEYNDNLETPMKQIPNIQLKLTPDLFFLKYKKISHNQFISFRFVLGL